MKSGYNEPIKTGPETSVSREKSSVDRSLDNQSFFNNEQKDNFALTDSLNKEPMSECELLFSMNAPPIVSKFNNDKDIYKNQI